MCEQNKLLDEGAHLINVHDYGNDGTSRGRRYEVTFGGKMNQIVIVHA